MLQLTPDERALRRVLINDFARRGQVTSYAELARHAQPHCSMTLAPPFHGMFPLLGHISMYEVQHGRPMLTAVVVRQHDHEPGEGFYNLAEQLDYDLNGDPRGFWEAELSEVLAVWADDDPTRMADLRFDAVLEEIRVLRRSLKTLNSKLRATGTLAGGGERR